MTALDVKLRSPGRFGWFSGGREWLITLAATAASTYALDAVATASGVLLVATQLLGGFDRLSVLLFLAASYVLWGAGLWVNLKANRLLLEQTGTSTNALSKAAHDFMKRRVRSPRARRIAADVGYVGTEIAKETPYYAGAFAAVLLTDSISANDALIFLAGANLGAAVYEYGLAHAVRAFLRLKGAAGYASFENDWVSAEYLADYYSAVEPDELLTIAFLVDAMKDAKPGEPVLFFGVGPTLHHVFLAAGKASEIHLGDYLAANLEEIARWIACDRRAHDWRPFVRYTLECEGRVSASEQEIVRRETVTRAKITRLFEVDAACADPLGDRNTKRYGTVISAYCADSATSDRRQWEIYMKRIIGLVRPGGTFMTAALRRSRGYVVGGKVFPSADVDETDLSALLGQYFAPQDITIEVCDLPPSRSQGYSSIMLACARKKQAPPQRRNMRGLLKCST